MTFLNVASAFYHYGNIGNVSKMQGEEAGFFSSM